MFKNQLKYYRKLKEMTQIQVSKFLGVSRQAYQHYESGDREPSFDILKKLCVLFDCTADELLEIDTPGERAKVHISNSFNNSSNINVKIKK